MEDNSWIILLVSLLILFYFTIRLSLKTGLIKDMSSAAPKPYSLSRTQFAFWTVIIASVYLYLLWLEGFNFQNVVFSQSAMVLLGVSVSTTVGGRMTDVADTVEQRTRKQDLASKGFLHDLLTDAKGYSIARYQHVIFTLIMGVGFVVYAVRQDTMVEFDQNLLILSGISATGYLGVKTQENK